MFDLRPSVARFEVGQEIKEASGSGFAIKIIALDSKERTIKAEVTGVDKASAHELTIGLKLDFIPHRLGRFWEAKFGSFTVTLGGPQVFGIGAGEVSVPVDPTGVSLARSIFGT